MGKCLSSHMLLLNYMENKTDNIGFFDLTSGEVVSKRIVKAMESEEYGRKVKNIFDKLKNCEIEELSLNEVEIALKVVGISHNNIQLDLSKNGENYFIIKNNRKITKYLNLDIKGVLYDIQQLITHNNAIVKENNASITNFTQLREYLGVSESIWKRNIMPSIVKFNIIKKEKINNKFYLILNPLFSVKSRGVGEYVFKCFYEELIHYLHPMQHLLLAKMYGVNVDRNIYKQTKDDNSMESIDFSVV